MATHSFSVPTHLTSIRWWFSAPKTFNEARFRANIFMCLRDLCLWGTICKSENGTPKVARNAFNVGEIWNPVCYYGNKIVKVVLWSTFSRILLQRIKHFWCKTAEISFYIIFHIKFGWAYDVITWLICIF